MLIVSAMIYDPTPDLGQHLNEVCAKVLFQIARPSQYNAFSEPGRFRHAVRDMQL
jgi:hypothetical protein